MRTDGIEELIRKAMENRVSIKENYQCQKCKDRGYLLREEDGCTYMRDCDCTIEKRQKEAQERAINESGLRDKFKQCTLDTFKTAEPWQLEMFNAAKGYGQNATEGWLLFCGQSGCGKTHLAVAACNELLNRGFSVRYMSWRELGAKIKRNANDDVKYTELTQSLKNCDVLYIDDLFKGGKTEADINLAFELLNHRYDRNKMTIISTECAMGKLSEIDEAIAGRIAEMAAGKIIQIAPKKGRNKRVG